MTEIIIVIFGLLWVSLFFIEQASYTNSRMSKYGWLAYAFRPILFFAGIGLYVIFSGTDWNSPLWEMVAGIICILLGLLLGIRVILNREEYARKLKDSKIKPSGVE